MTKYLSAADSEKLKESIEKARGKCHFRIKSYNIYIPITLILAIYRIAGNFRRV